MAEVEQNESPDLREIFGEMVEHAKEDMDVRRLASSLKVKSQHYDMESELEAGKSVKDVAFKVLKEWHKKHQGPDAGKRLYDTLANCKAQHWKDVAQKFREDLLAAKDGGNEEEEGEDAKLADVTEVDFPSVLSPSSDKAKLFYHAEKIAKTIKVESALDDLFGLAAIDHIDYGKLMELRRSGSDEEDVARGLLESMVNKSDEQVKLLVTTIISLHPDLNNLFIKPLPRDADLEALAKGPRFGKKGGILSRMTNAAIRYAKKFSHDVMESIRHAMMEVIGCKECSVVIMGKTGAGKSTLINSLLGESGAVVAARGAEAVTQRPECKTKIIQGLTFNIWDTPGLFDRDGPGSHYIEMMQKDIGEFHLVLLAVPIPDSVRFGHDDELVLEMLYKEFGENIFKNMVIVFTKANLLLNVCMDDVRKQKVPKGTDYHVHHRDMLEGLMKQFKECLRRIGVKTEVPMLPAGEIDFRFNRPLPVGRYYMDWYPKLWTTCLTRAQDRGGLTFVELARRQGRIGRPKRPPAKPKRAHAAQKKSSVPEASPAAAKELTKGEPSPHQPEREAPTNSDPQAPSVAKEQGLTPVQYEVRVERASSEPSEPDWKNLGVSIKDRQKQIWTDPKPSPEPGEGKRDDEQPTKRRGMSIKERQDELFQSAEMASPSPSKGEKGDEQPTKHQMSIKERQEVLFQSEKPSPSPSKGEEDNEQTTKRRGMSIKERQDELFQSKDTLSPPAAKSRSRCWSYTSPPTLPSPTTDLETSDTDDEEEEEPEGYLDMEEDEGENPHGPTVPPPPEGFWMRIATHLQNSGDKLITKGGAVSGFFGRALRGGGNALARLAKKAFLS